MSVRFHLCLGLRVIVTVLLSCGVATAQFSIPGLPGLPGRGGNPPAPTATPGEDGVNEGGLEDYLEMRAFAAGLYNRLEGDAGTLRASDFKRRVDKAYEVANKADMQRAFEMNTSAKSEVRYVIEDRFRVYTGLYDNPLVQALVNRVGQSVVASNGPRLYTFKLVADPVPWAESLSTGTVWVSTGMVALMKTKAELAYVLAHEAAHAFLEHHRQRLLLQFAQEEYNRQLAENGDDRLKRNSWLGIGIGVAGGAVLGAATGDVVGGAVLGSVLGGLAGNLVTRATTPGPLGAIEWNRFEEDEADQVAMDWLLAMNIDVTKVPDVYVALRDIGDRDSRARLGFLGRTDRVRERLAKVQERIKFEMSQPGWAKRVPEVRDESFDLVLAEVQRDNGVFAFHYDMLETARDNLGGAVAIKANDPTALYFYARVLSQTARTDEERAQADGYFLRAAENDFRNHNYGSFLHRAIATLSNPRASPADKTQSIEFLKQYVVGYHLSGADADRAQNFKLPPHLESVYDYLARAGEFTWKFDQETYDRVKAMVDKGVPVIKMANQLSSAPPASQTQKPAPNPGAKPTPTKTPAK